MRNMMCLVYGFGMIIATLTIVYISRNKVNEAILNYMSTEPQDKGTRTSLLGIYDNLKNWNGTRPRTNIIILTYMRSGSSLTGGLIRHHPDVFYTFEPEHFLKRLSWSQYNKDLFFLNKKKRHVSTFIEYTNEVIRIANGYLQCRFVDIDIGTLSDYILDMGSHISPYLKCLRSHDGGTFDIIKCLDILYKKCSDSPVSVIKTIQFSMSAVETMMMTNPSLKVIHLVRDPRPTFISQAKAGRFKMSQLSEDSMEQCDRMNKDLEATERIMKTYPGRVKLLLYEDLVMSPMEHVKELYSFADLDYDYEETKQYVKSIMEAEVDDPSGMVKKLNASKHAVRWREKASYSYARTVDDNCKLVYEKLGYVPVESEKHLVDLARSLKIKGTLF